MSAFDDLWSLNLPRLRVSLRIRGDTVDPDFVTQQLGVAPDFSARKGEEVEHGGVTSPSETGMWVYRIDVAADTDLGDAIRALLDRLPDDTTMWEELVEAYHVEVFCGVFLQSDNQGATVEPEVMGALGRRGLALSFDFYGPFGLADGQ